MEMEYLEGAGRDGRNQLVQSHRRPEAQGLLQGPEGDNDRTGPLAPSGICSFPQYHSLCMIFIERNL